MKIYVASSWRNPYYPDVVKALQDAGHGVYDFRNPPSGGHGFKWSEINPDYMQWSPERHREELQNNPLAQKQLSNDIEALQSCDACLLVLPCGRSAHTEAGWMSGAGKRVVVYIPCPQEPELMYGLFDAVCLNMDEVIEALA